MKNVLIAVLLVSSSAFAANGQPSPDLAGGRIRCTAAAGEGDIDVIISDSLSYTISDTQGAVLAKGEALYLPVTTGESLSYNSNGFDLSVSPFATHPFGFPTLWAMFWAKLSLDSAGIQGMDVACANF